MEEQHLDQTTLVWNLWYDPTLLDIFPFFLKPIKAFKRIMNLVNKNVCLSNVNYVLKPLQFLRS